MSPGSSLRPPLSHVIIDLSLEIVASFVDQSPKSVCDVQLCFLFCFSPFEKKMLLSLHPPHAHTLGMERDRVHRDS